MIPAKKAEPYVNKYQPDPESLRLIGYVNECARSGEAYRSTFIKDWTKTEEHLRCQHPEAWKKKKDWQTKVFLPVQSKTSETAASKFDEILWTSNRNFDIEGVEQKDREQDGYIMTVIENVLSRGDFSNQKSFMLQEAIDLGTSFLKLIPNAEGDGFDYAWVSVYHALCDGKARHDFYKSTFWIHEYKKDIGLMIEDAKINPKSNWKMSAIIDLINAGQDAAATTEGQTQLALIRGIDNSEEIFVPHGYKEVTIREFWGKVPLLRETKSEDGTVLKTYYEYKDVMMVVANDTVLMRKEDNDLGILPVLVCRTKRRKFDVYGKGYFSNTSDIQELMNSMICLGFDSLKISGMDIIGIDTTKVSDETSLVYEPLRVWKFKCPPREAMDIRRTGLSAMSDIMRGLGFMDTIHQDATGVTRHAQGAQATPGTVGGGSETLGEYQSKSLQVDKRFLKEAKVIEDEFILRLIKYIYTYIVNVWDQKAVDRILGVIEEEQPITDLQGTAVAISEDKKKISKLQLSKLPKNDMFVNFKVLGVSQFYQKQEILGKLEKLMAMAQVNPVVLQQIEFQAVFKRYFQLLGVPDYQDMLKGDKPDMIKLMQMMNLLRGGQSGQSGDQGGTTSIPGMSGGAAGGMAGGGSVNG